MNELNEIRSKLHEEIKNSRNIEHYLRQPYFENLWIVSEKSQKETLKTILEKKDKSRLISWIRNHPSLSLGEKNIRQLRKDAKDSFLPGYSRMNKYELLISLKNHLKHPEEKTNLGIEDMICEIDKILDDMIVLFPEAKIKEDYLIVVAEAKDFDLEIIIEAFDWIQNIRDNEFQQAKEIKGLLPESTWVRYKAWEDFGDHREVLLLNEALQNLRKAIINSNRPALFVRHKVKGFINKAKKKGEKNG